MLYSEQRAPFPDTITTNIVSVTNNGDTTYTVVQDQPLTAFNTGGSSNCVMYSISRAAWIGIGLASQIDPYTWTCQDGFSDDDCSSFNLQSEPTSFAASHPYLAPQTVAIPLLPRTNITACVNNLDGTYTVSQDHNIATFTALQDPNIWLNTPGGGGWVNATLITQIDPTTWTVQTTAADTDCTDFRITDRPTRITAVAPYAHPQTLGVT